MKGIIYKVIIVLLLFLLLNNNLSSQERFVQVSGIISDVTDNPVPGVAVISKKLRRGTISEATGIYSITSTPGDTILFRALGFKRYHTVVPSDYDKKLCMVDIVLEADTIPIEEVTILPWKTYNEFIQDMTRERPVDQTIENMNENLASIYVAVTNEVGVSITPEAGYRYAMEQNFNAMATRYQYPVNNLLNPFAWVKFIDGIKNGLFKNKSNTKTRPAKAIKKKRKKRKKNESE